MIEYVEHFDGGFAHVFIAGNGDRVLVVARDEMLAVFQLSGDEVQRMRSRLRWSRGRPRRTATEATNG